MKIEIEIEEKIPEIITEILYSGKWHSIVTDDSKGLKRAIIKNFMHDTVAFIEIWEHEIHIRTSCCNSTYRIFGRNGHVVCEYIGACSCCKLLDKQIFLKLTPLRNIHHYIPDKESPHPLCEQDEAASKRDKPQPNVLYDEFIHEYLPISLHRGND